MDKQKMVDLAVFLLRIAAGIIFVEHGGTLLFGWFGGAGVENLPPLILAAGILEFAGGIAVLLGLFLRPTAFLLSGLMAVAYFMAHAAKGFWYAPPANGGDPAALFAFIFLFFAAYGAGIHSIDAYLKSRK